MKYTEKIQENIFIIRLNSLDSDVFIEVYHYYIDRIYRYIYYRVLVKEDAEDLTSEVFIKAWQYIYNQQNKIKYLNAFLFQIARNLISDYYRKNAKTDIMENLDALKEIVDEKQENVLHSIDTKYHLSHIEKALHQLKDEYKEAILLFYIEELSCSEISKILNKSKGAIRVTLHRAMKELRKKLIQTNL